MIKRLAVLLVSLLMLAILAAGCGGSGKDKVEPGTGADPAEAVRQFEQDVQAAQAPALAAAQDFAAQGEGSAQDAYQAASVAREKCKQAQEACFKMETPAVEGEVGVLLNTIKLEYSTAYMLKAEAFESAMAYLDSDKPGDLKKYEEKMADADRFMQSAAGYLADAKKKAGLD